MASKEMSFYGGLIILLALASPIVSAESVCDRCRCSDKQGVSTRKVTLVDCTGISFPDVQNWPYQLNGNETPTAFIDAKIDYTSITHLHPLPAVPIIRFSATHNHIVKVDEDTFLELAAIIEEIDLSSNRLTSIGLQPNAFRGKYSAQKYLPLIKLRVLRLGRNALHSLHPDLFEHLPALEELYLNSNPMTVLDAVSIRAIATIVNLKVLDLSSTGLSTLPDNFLHTPRFLEKLDLSSNMMTTIPPTLGQAKELKTLILDGNRFTHLKNNSFPSIPKLTSLSISLLMELESIEDGALSKLISLKELYCTFNPRLDDIQSYALAGITDGDDGPSLNKLILNNNKLSYLHRNLVSRWEQLEMIALQGNPWSCDCLNQWMVNDLSPILEKIDPDMMLGMMCHSPPELSGKTFKEIVFHSPHLRCLDKYENHPEGDGAMLIGVMIGALLAIPIALTLFVLWRQRAYLIGSCFPEHASTASRRFPGPGAGDYSRAFYKRADSPAVGEI